MRFLTAASKLRLTILFVLVYSIISAQGVKLGIQGILKRGDGAAVPNGNYSLTFRIYDVAEGGTALWTETQGSVPVSSGLYSAVLGSVTSLDLPFNTDYFVGVSVASTPEMSPRLQLSTAPYALSVRGSTNKFPNSGAVGAGTTSPTAGFLLHLKNGTGSASQLIEGTTGAGLTFVKGSSTTTAGLGNADNILRVNPPTNGSTLFRRNSTDVLDVTNTGVTVTGSGTFSEGLTSSTGASKLNNLELDGSNNFNNTLSTATLLFRRNGSDRIKINADVVEVAGHLNVDGGKNSGNISYGWFARDGQNDCTNSGTASGDYNYSVSANDRIRATEFNAISDKRIKKDITPADNLADQEILRRLRVCDYRHIDEVRTGSALKKGFIAQEVREVFPEAVISSRGFVPDIYDGPENYKVQAGQLLISMTGEHGLAAGDMVRLMLPEGQRDLQVATVLDGRSFLVSGWEGGRPEWVFVFGKQVEDFLQVDYDRIHTLNVSATKELIRQVEGAQSDTESVRRDIEGNKSRIDQLELRMRALEARVSN